MKKELLFSVHKNDFIVQVFRAGGKGGQKQNKTSSGVRIIHPESGARGESREERSQSQNKKNALKRLVESKEFQLWHKRKAIEMIIDKENIEKQVDNLMREENLRVEVKENGKWVSS